MNNARQSSQWWHTANLLAMTAELNRDDKKRAKAFDAKDFHPDHANDKPTGNANLEDFKVLAGENTRTIEPTK